MPINNDLFDLRKLGFSENEALVYQVLLQQGASAAGNIIAKTNLHRNIVYTALDHLVDKKLISAKNMKGKMIFESITPNILITELKEKQESAENLLRYYQQITTNRELREISVHEGNDEYLRLLSTLINSMPARSTKYVLGTGGEDFMKQTMRPIWDKYHKVVRKKNVHIKMLGYSSQKESIDHDVSNINMYEIKYVESNNPNPAGLHIYPEIDTVLNIIYSTEYSPVTAICIKNKALTKAYLNLFENMWTGIK